MSTTLSPVLDALGVKERTQQVAFIQLLQASGAYGELPGVCGMASYRQAEAILDNCTYHCPKHALEWLKKSTSQHFAQNSFKSPALTAIAQEIEQHYPALESQMTILKSRIQQREQHLEQVTMVDPVTLVIDPERFQFRRNIDTSGVTQKGRQQGAYDPLLQGDLLLLWEDTKGQRFVVDGHHRTNHFKELRAQGQGPQVVPARILREADGYTALDAKIVGAYKNFVHDHDVNKVDAAVVFHEVASGKVHRELLPQLQLGENLAVAYSASKLSEPAFGMVTRGEVQVEEAATVADKVKSADQQLAVMNMIKHKLEQSGAGSWASRIQNAPDSTRSL